MPNKRKSKHNSNSLSRLTGGGNERVTVVSGQCAFNFTIIAGQVVISNVLNDSVSSALLALSDTFGLYRFTAIRYDLYPAITVGTIAAFPSVYAVGFTPEALLASPAGINDTMQLPYVAIQGITRLNGGATIACGQGVSSFTVPRAALFKTGVKWFRTQGLGSEADWETQGTFIAASNAAAVTTSTVIAGRLMYTCEFTDQLPTAVTRDRMKKQIKDKLVQEVSKTLSAPVNFSGPSQPSLSA